MPRVGKMPDLPEKIDADLECPKCGDRPYRVFMVQNVNPDGQVLQSFRTEIRPTPADAKNLRCASCDLPLRRVKANA